MTATVNEAPTSTSKGATGRIARVIGPVVDVEFSADTMPEQNNALTTEVTMGGSTQTVTLEVASHLGDNMVRAISLKPTDGMVRGAAVVDTGAPISVPVGNVTLGRVFNAIGECLNLEDGEKLEITERWPIHRKAPSFDQLESQDHDVRDRHQGHRPPHPLRPGRQDRSLRGCGRRQDRPHPGDDPARRAEPRRCVGVRGRRRAHP